MNLLHWFKHTLFTTEHEKGLCRAKKAICFIYVWLTDTKRVLQTVILLDQLDKHLKKHMRFISEGSTLIRKWSNSASQIATVPTTFHPSDAGDGH